MSPVDLSLVDLYGSVRHSSTFACILVGFFPSMLLFIGDSCCSGALVPWGLSTTTFRLSTTTSFVRLRRGRAAAAACFQLASVLVVVVRWSTDLDVIFIISGVHYTSRIEDK